jgi:hypothetical protein
VQGESEEESNGRSEVPARCALAVVTARQPVCGSVLVISLYWMTRDVAVAPWRQVPHGNGLLGVARSGFLVSPLAWGCVLLATTCASVGGQLW